MSRRGQRSDGSSDSSCDGGEDATEHADAEEQGVHGPTPESPSPSTPASQCEGGEQGRQSGGPQSLSEGAERPTPGRQQNSDASPDGGAAFLAASPKSGDHWARRDSNDGENGQGGKQDAPQGRELVQLAAPMWSAGHTAEQLGLTRDELDQATAAGLVLGVTAADSNRTSYPTAQFERTSDGSVRVKRRLQGFITTLLAEGARDPWTCVICLNLPSPELDGMTPLGWARAGRDPETLTAFARLLNAEHNRP